ncbi:hypothetical protein OAG16_01555 [Saprospiraceae bacterium]|jgi:hypothetical protein|nr:hypothetical protein [Saprospiraceae bacterium]
MKNLMPLTNLKKTELITADGELKIKYLPGYPRSYRFDASRGTFNENGETVLTKKGQAFTFAPIAYRKFKDDIMGYGVKTWIEFFFLNESLQVCALMFHGFSVDEFMRLANRMFYDGVSPCDCLITATPNEKVSNHPDAKGQKYFIAQFSYKPMPKADAVKLEQSTQVLQLWRQDSTTGDAEVQLFQNWNPPHNSDNNTITENPKIETELLQEAAGA